MEKFPANKLGEVLAFTRFGLGIFELGKQALERELGESSMRAMSQMAQEQKDAIERIAVQEGVADTVEDKAYGTELKLKQMQGLYLQGKWDESSELLEWLGFFEGAALVHWKLVEGVAQSLSNPELARLVDRALSMHQALLFKVSEAIRRLGQNKTVLAS